MDDNLNKCMSMFHGGGECRMETGVIKARWNAGVCIVWSRESYDGFLWDHTIYKSGSSDVEQS